MKLRAWLFYAAIIAVAIGAFLLLRRLGEHLTPASWAPSPSHGLVSPSFPENILSHALLALVVIIGTARLLGMLFRHFHQTQVVGEMIAGILLGPSLLGRVAPVFSTAIFPSAVLPYLLVIAQLGIVLYMFLVGLDLDPGLLRQRTESSVAISHASIIVPLLLGSALALALYPAFATPGVSFTVFALFIGVAMSVTAFPVLARILTDQNLQATRLGTLAIACAAADDVTAWCLLAFVLGVAQAEPGRILLTITLTLAFILVVWFVVRPAARWMVQREAQRGGTTQDRIVIATVAVLAAGLATQRIGIHALFGAFLIGVAVPRGTSLAREAKAAFESFVVILLLPVFFAVTGLRTQIGLLHSLSHWLICLLIIAVASAGKFGGSFLAARLTGSPVREAAALGVLLNTRGLMELIVLNVGLDLGVLSPTLFTMLVLMALVTTLVTSPLLQLISARVGQTTAPQKADSF